MRGWGKYEIVLQRRYLRLQKSICTSTHLLDSLGIRNKNRYLFMSLSTAVCNRRKYPGDFLINSGNFLISPCCRH